jgi:hypothetical protein
MVSGVETTDGQGVECSPDGGSNAPRFDALRPAAWAGTVRSLRVGFFAADQLDLLPWGR